MGCTSEQCTEQPLGNRNNVCGEKQICYTLGPGQLLCFNSLLMGFFVAFLKAELGLARRSVWIILLYKLLSVTPSLDRELFRLFTLFH